MLHKYKTDSKRICQVMKKITGKQKAKSNLLLREIKSDKTIAQNPKDAAQEFNKYFTSVGPNLMVKIPNTEKTF